MNHRCSLTEGVTEGVTDGASPDASSDMVSQAAVEWEYFLLHVAHAKLRTVVAVAAVDGGSHGNVVRFKKVQIIGW